MIFVSNISLQVLKDGESGLTDTALKGTDKQSIAQAETLLSYHVASSLQRLGYPLESCYVRKIAQWHEASDGRAIQSTEGTAEGSQLMRQKYNTEMLSYLMEDYIPWQSSQEHYDFRIIDINR